MHANFDQSSKLSLASVGLLLPVYRHHRPNCSSLGRVCLLVFAMVWDKLERLIILHNQMAPQYGSPLTPLHHNKL